MFVHIVEVFLCEIIEMNLDILSWKLGVSALYVFVSYLFVSCFYVATSNETLISLNV